jgi:hypothetical protein
MTLIDGDTVLYHMTAAMPGTGRKLRGDFMATVWVSAGQLQAEYRFRYHVTPDKMDMDGGADDDRKSFFTIGPVADGAEERALMIAAFKKMEAEFADVFVRVHSEEGSWTVEQFMLEVMQRSPMTTQMTRLLEKSK